VITEETEAVICLAWETRGEEYAQGVRAGFAATPAQPGWTWLKKARLACNLILNPDSMPRDMVKTLTESWGPVTGPRASEETMNAALAQMRGDLKAKAAARQEREAAGARERAAQRADEARAARQPQAGAA